MDQLNDRQRQAVTEGDGAALVLAGAGSGKTRVVVERMAWLIDERGVDPRGLLALTFTNRAASEMRKRVAARLGMDTLPAWVGTFHSFGLYVLRRNMEHLGRSKSFTVFDDADQLSLMKQLIKDLPLKFTRVSPREALSWVSRLKQDLLDPSAAESPVTEEEETYHELWSRYHGALERVSAVDFDDLLVLMARLLDEHEAVRERYQRRFRYVHVDEYQDTNHAQYRIAKHLSGGYGNLFVVGDEDQAIYSWRGASIRNILQFEEDFPDARVFRLEQNYRSTGPILDAANAVVAHNEERLGKTLWTARKAGCPVRYYWAQDGADEARFVVGEVRKSGADPREVAVLFRTNAQSRALEEALRRERMAYVLIGGTQFYARKEVKDLLAYLRLLTNPADDVSLRRILNVPPRGIGTTTLAQLDEYAAARGVSLLEVLRDVDQDQTLLSRARNAAAEFVHLVHDLALAAKEMDVAELVKLVIGRTDYREYVQRSDEKDSRSRLEVVDEFVSACAQFQKEGAREANLADFLQDLALMSDVDSYDPETPAVTLLTCHSAKGLEFDHVFLVGLEEGLLPHASALEDDREVEEERRLCYVAMTRARKGLTLTSARERVLYGERQKRRRSRFLDEIPESKLDVVGLEAQAESPRRKRRADAPGAEAGQVKMGTRVRHGKFGNGTVMYTMGTGKKLRARIRFDTGRTRDFMVSVAPLEILKP
jgi:DNA helicase-2/ATP-dependent DNA helicase PcrA